MALTKITSEIIESNLTLTGTADGSTTPLTVKNTSTNAASEARLEFNQGGTSHGYITSSYNSNSPFMAFSVGSGSAEKVRITSAGNLGIGTTSASVALEVHKDASSSPVFELKNTNAAGYSGMHIRNNSDTLIGHIGYGNASVSGALADEVFFGSISNTPVVFTQSDSERMRINTSGHLLITGGDTNDRGGRLQVYGATTTSASTFRVGTNGYPAINLLNQDAAQQGYITVNSSSVSYTSVSDYRLKENIVTDWDATTRLKQLRPSRFNFIADADTTVDGFLAHEVSDIVPEAITGEKDATETIGNVLDSDGDVIKENVSQSDANVDTDAGETWQETGTRPVYQAIDQAKLVPLLVKALQEANAKIEALETRIETLENA